MKMVQEETRKGPWTEPEDLQLVYFVGIFGERRWDFIAKVSGLNRTGKSCRLRWVNYLHPGLKRGRMTPQEERLVLELHSRWGNRWSRIARKLPGRTDNEIKNYWRTHTRKKAQEIKRAFSPSSSASNCYLSSSSSSSSLINPPSMGLLPKVHIDGDERGPSDLARDGENEELGANGYSMDQIWQEIALGEVNSGALYEGCEEEEGCNFSCPPPLASPLWDCSDSLWKMAGEEIKMMLPTGVVHFVSNSSLSEL